MGKPHSLQLDHARLSHARLDPIADLVADLELNLNKLELSVLLKYGLEPIQM
jgi:hypothetical protein